MFLRAILPLRRGALGLCAWMRRAFACASFWCVWPEGLIVRALKVIVPVTRGAGEESFTVDHTADLRCG